MNILSFKWYSFIFIVLIIIVFFFLGVESNKLLINIKQISITSLLIQIIFGIISGLLNGFINWKVLKTFKINLNFMEWFGLSFFNSLANYILPAKLGTIAKAYYLKKQYQFSISQSASILVFSTIVAYAVLFGILGSILILNSIFLKENFSWVLYLGYLFLILVVIFFLLLFRFKNKNTKLKREKNTSRFWNIIYLFFDGMEKISKEPFLLIQIIIINSFAIFLNFFRLQLAFFALGVYPSFFKVSLVQSFNYLGMLSNITPGNFGLQELIISYSSQLMNFSIETGLAAAALIRFGEILPIFIIGLWAFYKLNIRLKE